MVFMDVVFILFLCSLVRWLFGVVFVGVGVSYFIFVCDDF